MFYRIYTAIIIFCADMFHIHLRLPLVIDIIGKIHYSDNERWKFENFLLHTHYVCNFIFQCEISNLLEKMKYREKKRALVECFGTFSPFIYMRDFRWRIFFEIPARTISIETKCESHLIAADRS